MRFIKRQRMMVLSLLSLLNGRQSAFVSKLSDLVLYEGKSGIKDASEDSGEISEDNSTISD